MTDYYKAVDGEQHWIEITLCEITEDKFPFARLLVGEIPCFSYSEKQYKQQTHSVSAINIVDMMCVQSDYRIMLYDKNDVLNGFS